VLGQPLGGVVRHNAELLPRLAGLLAARGGQLAVLEGRVPIEFDLPESVERYRSDVPWLPTSRRAASEGRALRAVLESARAAGRAFDLVHFGHHPLPRRLGAPVTITVHDLRTLDYARASRVRRWLAPRVLGPAFRRAAGLFTVSAATRARLAFHFGLDEARITLIPNAVDHLAPLPRVGAVEPFLLHVGHVERRKNLGRVLAALAHDTSLPRLVVAGLAKSGEDQRLAALARDLGVASRLELLGAVDAWALRELYATAAAVVLPSELEGFGITALEALASGAPLAASSIPAHVEVIGDAAEFFAPGDTVGCAAAVRRALTHGPDEVRRGRTRALEFRWETSAVAWCDGLVRAAAKTGGGGP